MSIQGREDGAHHRQARGVWRVCDAHGDDFVTSVGIALGMSLLLVSVPSVAANRVSTKASIAAALVIAAALGLAIAWATAMHRNTEHASRILNDLGWAQATVGTWFAYSNVVAASVSKIARVPFDDATRARWRAHELSFGVEARASHRDSRATELGGVRRGDRVARAATASRDDALGKSVAATADVSLIALRESLRGKGGVGETSEARFQARAHRVRCDRRRARSSGSQRRPGTCRRAIHRRRSGDGARRRRRAAHFRGARSSGGRAPRLSVLQPARGSNGEGRAARSLFFLCALAVLAIFFAARNDTRTELAPSSRRPF